MKSSSSKDLSLRIDVCNHRICIHRSTLRQIGEPEFIHIGFQPGTTNLIVLGTWVDERRAIRVRFTKGGSFFVNSKPLIEGIRNKTHCLENPGSYLLKGKKIGGLPAISFSLKEDRLETDDNKENEQDG